MSDVTIKKQCFGIEIEMTGITRHQAAIALGGLFGTDPVLADGALDPWVIKDSAGKEWTLERSERIRAERPVGEHYERVTLQNFAVKLVSPMLTYDEIPQLQEAIRALRKIGAKTNESCRLHVHIDSACHNRQSIKNLLCIMYSKEDLLFKALKVSEERAKKWCQKVREPMLKQMRKLSAEETADLTQLEEIWYADYDGDMGRCLYDHDSRYYALNLHSVFFRGTVEFRMFNSTLHAGIVKAYVHLCLAMSAQAIQQRSAVMYRTHSDNEAFSFRTWLVRMGLNGEEFKRTREHLLAHLEGDRVWRHDRESYPANQKKQKSREMER